MNSETAAQIRNSSPPILPTTGMPAIALLFHPLLAPDFKFSCEGLGDWEGNAAWQVHFEQRSDRPGQSSLAYAADGKCSSLALKGRAWIDPEPCRCCGWNQS